MNTVVPNLNILDALKNAISFCLEFPKKYPIVTALFATFFFLNSLYANWVMSVVKSEIDFSNHPDPLAVMQAMFDIKFAPPYISLSIFGAIVAYCVIYYAIRMALAQLDSSAVLANKSLLKSIWQLFCMHLAIGLVAIPLYLLFVIPGIWWSIKTSAATANLLTTDDGPIESIKKSLKLTDNKFWGCLGYLLGTWALPAFVFAIAMGIIGLIIILPALFFLHAGARDDLRIMAINGLLQAISMFFQILIMYFCQSWLYVYLKTQAKPEISALAQ